MRTYGVSMISTQNGLVPCIMPFYTAEANNSLERGSRPYTVVEILREVFNEDFEKAAVWNLNIKGLPTGSDAFLKIDYAGDCARVYADGKLVMDNFWNGKPMLVRMSDLAGKNVELRILPLRKDAPIYLQKTQKALLDNSKESLLKLEDISILSVLTY